MIGAVAGADRSARSGLAPGRPRGPPSVTPSIDTDAVLRVVGMRKQFPGTLALDDVDLDIRRGEIHALLGENGAGKSTLIKCVCGAYAPTAGHVEVDGRRVRIGSPAEATAAGIGVVHQHLNLVPNLSVAENIWLGAALPRRAGLVDWRAVHARARDVLDRVGVDISTTATVDTLRPDSRAVVSIAKAISGDARVIILDEPTNALLPTEVERLFEQMRRLAADGHSFLYVSHRLSEVIDIADRATVLRDGRHVGTFDEADMTPSAIVAAIVGREEGKAVERRSRTRPDAAPVLAARALSGPGVSHVSFEVRPGEILGIAGLPGAGADEVLDLVFGRTAMTGGTLSVKGRPLRPRHPADAIAAGIGLVPKDRLEEAVLHGAPIRQNTSLPSLGAFARIPLLRLIDKRREARAVTEVTDRMRVKMTGIEASIDGLSGGNQQKVVLGRWLASGAEVLILNSPTAAVDVGAKAEIYALIDELAADGKSIVFASTEIEEYPMVCDRVLVMHRGRVTRELTGGDMTERKIMTAAAGGHATHGPD